jgi:hypothetical protein
MNPFFTPSLLARPLSLALFALVGTTAAQAQTMPEVLAELRQLRAELQQVRSELDSVKKQQAPAVAGVPPAPGWPVEATPAANGNLAVVVSAPAVAGGMMPTQSENPLSFFGYGEMNYVRPRNDAASATATLRRGVLGFGYRFSERTRMAAELEVENAVVSASDKGEVEFEQMYIEHDLTDRISAKAGLFLMPVGYLNESHEPTRYFGVERNLVETAIIPSTWREMGVGLRGTTESGLRWDAGLVTSFDLTKWDATSTDGRVSPLNAVHGEGQLAKARSVATYGALNYNGIPGFNVGGSVFQGGVGQKQPGFASPNAKVTLAEVHSRWQPGAWDLSALAAQGRFSDVDALNATFAGQANPVPGRFGGWYGQVAYKVWTQGEYSLLPFARYERLNTASRYSGLPIGLSPATAPDTRLATWGASFFLNPQVVVKADYRRYLSNKMLDSLNFGVGFQF